eukprot:gb/GECH01014099.1/.p1 GENE.gb/GECH01014099.1/~~gb/GECH01014099.1/.p1  ORF type:complete len:189 (+),score=40.83 gb/GECH01014099.1/:1-567(+)
MGNKLSLRVLVIGLDNSGKTTAIHQLAGKQESIDSIEKTVGFNVEEVRTAKAKFDMWDVAGGANVRELWRHYYEKAEALIFVVDSADQERMEEAHNELSNVLLQPTLANLPVLVLANKQDAEGAMPPGEVESKMGLTTVANRKLHVQGTCARDGTGLKEGMEWLVKAAKGTDPGARTSLSPSPKPQKS